MLEIFYLICWWCSGGCDVGCGEMVVMGEVVVMIMVVVVVMVVVVASILDQLYSCCCHRCCHIDCENGGLRS